jgi:hypothetical protein
VRVQLGEHGVEIEVVVAEPHCPQVGEHRFQRGHVFGAHPVQPDGERREHVPDMADVLDDRPGPRLRPDPPVGLRHGERGGAHLTRHGAQRRHRGRQLGVGVGHPAARAHVVLAGERR